MKTYALRVNAYIHGNTEPPPRPPARASCMPGKHSTTELHPQPLNMLNYDNSLTMMMLMVVMVIAM
jgi:hypothetical protein